MASNAIVKYLNAFKDNLPSLLTGGKAAVVQVFRFERAKETLYRCIDLATSIRFVSFLIVPHIEYTFNIC